jgi:hypothetical protein
MSNVKFVLESLCTIFCARCRLWLIPSSLDMRQMKPFHTNATFQLQRVYCPSVRVRNGKMSSYTSRRCYQGTLLYRMIPQMQYCIKEHPCPYGLMLKEASG